MRVKRSQIDQFFAAKRIALIGVSRNEKSYSRMLFREFAKQGYDAIPINPNAQELDGHRCWKTIREVAPCAEAAVIVLPESQRRAAVHECVEAGVSNVWVYGKLKQEREGNRMAVAGSGKPMNLITNLCPFMFLPNAVWIHRLHATLMKLARTYPQ